MSRRRNHFRHPPKVIVRQYTGNVPNQVYLHGLAYLLVHAKVDARCGEKQIVIARFERK